MIELTDEQQQAIDTQDCPIRIVDPKSQREYVVLRADLYDRIRELLEDEREQKTVLAYSMKQAAQLARDNSY